MRAARRTARTATLAAVAATAVTACSATAAGPPPTADPTAVVQRYVEIVNSADLDELDQVIAAEFSQAGGFGPLTGPDGARAAWGEVLAAFPDARLVPTRITAAGELVTLEARLSGTHDGPYLGQAPTGKEVAASTVEVLTVRDDRIVDRTTVLDRLAIAQELGLPVPAPDATELLPAETLYTAPPGVVGFEGVTADPTGNLYLTTFGGPILKLAPDGTATPFGTLAAANVAADADGTVYADTGGGPDGKAVWSIAPDGTATRLADLPADASPNGIAHDKSDGSLYVADSLLGRVYRIADGIASVLVEDPLLAPRALVGGIPGANGIKVFGDTLYVSNPDTSAILAVPLAGGAAAGPVRVHATGIPTDDFALDVQGNLYATTHPYNSVVRIAPDGTSTVVADLSTGALGPTSAFFGTAPGDESSLYVVGDGGWYAALSGYGEPGPEDPRGTLLRIDAGVPGHPTY